MATLSMKEQCNNYVDFKENRSLVRPIARMLIQGGTGAPQVAQKRVVLVISCDTMCMITGLRKPQGMISKPTTDSLTMGVDPSPKVFGHFHHLRPIL